MFNEENFINQANQCYKDTCKREITKDELNFAINLAKENNVKEEQMYNKKQVDLTNKIQLSSTTWFNYIMVTTYKQFNLNRHG